MNSNTSKLLLLLSFLFSGFIINAKENRSLGKPNILFILTDDHRCDALGFLGHPFLETPHLDRLAREGVYLKNAIVTTSLCSPSRASILSGMYAHAAFFGRFNLSFKVSAIDYFGCNYIFASI